MKNHRQQTYYDILGIRRDASTQEVRIAYQRLVRHHHPDRTGGDTIEIVILNEAYEVLKDPTKRKAYDQSLLIGRLTSEDLEALGRRMGKQVKDNLSALKDGLARVTRYTAYDRRPQASERPASGDIHLNLHADIWQVALGHIVAIDTGYEILHLKLQ